MAALQEGQHHLSHSPQSDSVVGLGRISTQPFVTEFLFGIGRPASPLDPASWFVTPLLKLHIALPIHMVHVGFRFSYLAGGTRARGRKFPLSTRFWAFLCKCGPSRITSWFWCPTLSKRDNRFLFFIILEFTNSRDGFCFEQLGDWHDDCHSGVGILIFDLWRKHEKGHRIDVRDS